MRMANHSSSISLLDKRKNQKYNEFGLGDRLSKGPLCPGSKDRMKGKGNCRAEWRSATGEMKIRDVAHIDASFFDIDEERHIARIELQFHRPEDIFDVSYRSRIPIFSDDFLDWINSAFQLVSRKNKIDLTILFDDMEGYTEEELQAVFRKNLDLEFLRIFAARQKRNRIAFGLCLTGVVLFLLMLAMNNLWDTESVWKQIAVYISDIATTVAFWEAMTILVVENQENNFYLANLKKRFDSIRFCVKGGKESD